MFLWFGVCRTAKCVHRNPRLMYTKVVGAPVQASELNCGIWVSLPCPCIKNFNQINHANELILINALILTTLINFHHRRFGLNHHVLINQGRQWFILNRWENTHKPSFPNSIQQTWWYQQPGQMTCRYSWINPDNWLITAKGNASTISSSYFSWESKAALNNLYSVVGSLALKFYLGIGETAHDSSEGQSSGSGLWLVHSLKFYAMSGTRLYVEDGHLISLQPLCNEEEGPFHLKPSASAGPPWPIR